MGVMLGWRYGCFFAAPLQCWEVISGLDEVPIVIYPANIEGA